MNPLEYALRAVVAYLEEAQIPFAVVGALAVSVWTEPRFTRDADLAVSVPGDSEAEALIRDLGAYECRVAATIEQDAVGRMAAVRLSRRGEEQTPVVDLLFASSGIEPEIVAAAERHEVLPDLTVGVACVGHLLALKTLSRNDIDRLQDLVDLRALLKVASPADLTLARESLELIAARGYHRGRSLLADFDTLLSR